jgi:hypothetical protein
MCLGADVGKRTDSAGEVKDLAEKGAVGLMSGDVPPREHIPLGITDVEQLHF